MTNQSIARLAISSLLVLGTASAAMAEKEYPPANTRVLAPAKDASGRTPIDLTNGILTNNGTYGLPDPAYQDWAKEPESPGLSDKFYPFEKKEAFVNGVQETVHFTETAIWNWQRTSDRWPEVKKYSQDAIERMQPILDRLKKSLDTAKSANAGSWQSAEDNTRRALVDLRLNYTQMHNNVVNR